MSPAAVMLLLLNSVSDDKTLDWSKLKAFTDDKINVAEKLKFHLGRVENIVGKGNNRAKMALDCSHEF